jgi:hypothetical protein
VPVATKKTTLSGGLRIGRQDSNRRMSARKADSLLNDAGDKKGNLMSAAQHLPAHDKPITFLDHDDDTYNQRVSSQLSDGTLTMYGYTCASLLSSGR